ncbi:MAG: hypothetical protein R3B92_00350 [Patescibacteria group bacterium]|uniref:DUF11 domain-containing protein n=1 Tax=candidate division WWE3 bacterium TaxID=2053526 RepID=A0A955J1P1_UNCKA|nr:DUF11 domain-containing protein [candidate division WWE3 bacterium]
MKLRNFGLLVAALMFTALSSVVVYALSVSSANDLGFRTFKTLSNEKPTQYGFVEICGTVDNNKKDISFVPPLYQVGDLRTHNWVPGWFDLSKTLCANSDAPISQQGLCHPFPNYNGDINYSLDKTKPYCTAGSLEKVHAYVCDSSVTNGHIWDGCGGNASYTYLTDNGGSLSLGDLDSIKQNGTGKGLECGSTVQLDIFNASCTASMIAEHYLLAESNPEGAYNPDNFPKDSQGVPTFCLAKDAFVWYSGSCATTEPFPTISASITKTIDTQASSGDDITYKKRDTIVFDIKVKNTGSSSLTNVKVEDIIPKYTQISLDKSRDLGSIWTCPTGLSSGDLCFLHVGSLIPNEEKIFKMVVSVDHYTSSKALDSSNQACVVADQKFSENVCATANFSLSSNKENTLNVYVDKHVKLTTSSTWQDKIFDVAKNQTFEFRISVKNNSESTVENLKIVDTLPDSLERLSGSGLTETIDVLAPGKVKEFIFIARVKGSEYTNNIDTCSQNKVAVYKNDENIADADSSVCYRTVAVSTLPTTGPIANMLMGIMGIISVFLGFALKAKYYLLG